VDDNTKELWENYIPTREGEDIATTASEEDLHKKVTAYINNGNQVSMMFQGFKVDTRGKPKKEVIEMAHNILYHATYSY